MFPAGLAGVALLLLRLCVMGTVLNASDWFGQMHVLTTQGLATLALIFALSLGLYTPIGCGGALISQMVSYGANGFANTRDIMIHLLLTTALLALGPGAYSIDSRLFGRKLIMPPEE